MLQSLDILNSFLAEVVRLKNAAFPYKTALSETNVKTNGMGNTKWNYRKARNFATNYFIFLKISFQFKNLLERVNLMYQIPKCPYSYIL